jgi:hypothetical protein
VAERLNVNITLAKDRKTGAVVELFQYSGAIEIQVAGGHSFTMEFRGMVPGTAVGADPAARMADAEAKVKADMQIRLDAAKAKVPGILTHQPVAPVNG